MSKHFFFNFYSFIFGCTGSLLLHRGFLKMQTRAFFPVAVRSFSLRWILLLQSMGFRAHGLR